jgi:hypothetical protein
MQTFGGILRQVSRTVCMTHQQRVQQGVAGSDLLGVF